MRIYGILDSNNCMIDTSKTLRGAKRYATINGYKTVASRDVNHYHVIVEAVKNDNNKWVAQ